MSGISAALMVAAVLAPAGSTATDLIPAGAWRIDPEPAKSACTMARDFGTGSSAVRLILEGHALDNALQVQIARIGGSDATPAAPVQIAFAPSGPSIAVVPRASFAGNGWRAARLTIDVDAQSRMRTSTAAIVTGDDGDRIRLTSFAAGQALTSLGRCIATVQRRLGIDPEQQAAIATPAKPRSEQAEWIQVADYPAAALRDRIGGTVTIMWTVEKDGSAAACRIVVSSGADLLDNAACAAIMQRASYDPAIDKRGKPIASQKLRSVTWMLPQIP